MFVGFLLLSTTTEIRRMVGEWARKTQKNIGEGKEEETPEGTDECENGGMGSEKDDTAME